MNLRPYQQEAVDNLRAAFKSAFRAPVLQLPTGGGKTIIFCHIAQSAAAKGNNVLILVHRRELIIQTSKALARLDLEHGVMAPGYKKNNAAIQVASVQALARRLSIIDFYPSLIIIDEAHHAVASTWDKILLHYDKAKLLGVTATPERLDGKGLEEHFDLLVKGPTVKFLIQNSFLSNLKVYTLPFALSRSLIKIKNKDFDLEESVQSLEDAGINGDAISEYTKRCPNKPAIVFCCNIRHAKQMADRFIKAGYKAAALVSKGVGPLERAQMIEDLGNGNLDVITSIDIISEGTDIPVVTTAILLRPTESLTIYLQQVGRVLRPAPDKEFAFIIDCVGNVQKHGMPQQDRDWSLEGTPKKDKSPSVFTCQSCYAVFERESSEWPVICPYCGHEHWPEEKPQEKPNVVLNVDLVEVEENENITTQHDRRKLIAKAACLEDFIEIGKLMGYKPGWAHIAWKERKAKISQAEWKPPAKPVKYHKFNMSEIMKQAGIPEPPWGK